MTLCPHSQQLRWHCVHVFNYYVATYFLQISWQNQQNKFLNWISLFLKGWLWKCKKMSDDCSLKNYRCSCSNSRSGCPRRRDDDNRGTYGNYHDSRCAVCKQCGSNYESESTPKVRNWWSIEYGSNQYRFEFMQLLNRKLAVWQIQNVLMRIRIPLFKLMRIRIQNFVS